MQATKEELSLCPGFGPQKVEQLRTYVISGSHNDNISVVLRISPKHI